MTKHALPSDCQYLYSVGTTRCYFVRDLDIPVDFCRMFNCAFTIESTYGGWKMYV